MKTPVAACENNRCEKAIHKGDEVWRKALKCIAQGNVYFNRSDTLNKRFCVKNILLEVRDESSEVI